MASAEQPLKKRKFYEAARSEPEPEPEPAPTSPPTRALSEPHNAAVSAPSHEEILMKRRNKDEIRSVYECYKRIKFCLSHKRDSDLEQAYLSLISASQGCTSVQCIVAELIPRYASYSPNAFEAAAKVVMNMHNWSLETIQKGEDIDGVAFRIAKSCISGLSDICCRACSEASVSSAIIREICSAVLQNALPFFISSLEDKDVFRLFGREFAKIRDLADEFHELRRKVSEGSEPPLVVLLKLRVLSLFRVFYRYPRNLLAACFDLFDSATLDGVRDGLYFLSQLTRKFDLDGAVPVLKTSDENKSQDAHPDLQTCFMAMVLRKDPSLRSWVVSNFKRISQLSTSKIFSEIKSIMENVVESFTEIAGADNDVHDSNSSESIKSSNFKRSRSYQHDTYFGSNSNVRVRGGSSDDASERVSGPYSSFHSEAGYQESGVMRNVDIGQHGETAHSIPSPVTRHSLEFRSNSFDSRNHGIGTDKRLDFRSPTGRSTSGGLSNPFASPKHNLANSQIIWHSDGDPATMDIFSASKQLWVGLLGPDTSEAHVRYEFERFGPIDHFFSFPTKGFCVIDYRNIFDAIKARDYLRRHLHWHIKFMDTGLGTRGVMNDVAVGSSCLVYIGSISNQWEKDEILYESSRVVYKGPSLITDLKNEGALLMELETPEEAAAVMAHLRQYRKERSSSLSHMDSAERGSVSPLTSLLVSLRAKYNVHQSSSYVSMQEEDKAPSSAIEITVPNNSPFLSDDEVAAVCNIAISNLGSVNSVARTNSQSGCTWYVECSGVDAAMAVLSNLRRCPEMFFQIQFSQQRTHHSLSFSGRTDSMELVSPRVAPESHLAAPQGGHPFHSNRGLPEMLEAGPGRIDGPDTNMAVDPSHGGNHGVSSEQNWVYANPEIDPPPPPGSVHSATQGHPVPPPLQIQSSQYMRPAYIPPNVSWDPQRGLHQNFPLNPISPVAVPNNAVASPFVHPQVQHFEPMFSVPMVAQPPLAPPPPPEMPPPLPPSPPPPSPNSPPPPPPESCQLESSEQCPPQYQWQGVLCKSGVHYCTINALAVHSDVCKYSSTSSEPTEWPAKLDMVKRTDFRHVQSTFKNTPSHKREVCMLVPSSPNDQKGFQDFTSYLNQRECAGVIKLPLSKSIWSRLLFILPYSLDFCSMFSIAPVSTHECLIALLLPKETNFEWL